MFALCALVPILIFGGISYFQVSGQLERQSYTRLQKEAKSHGLSIYERLLFIEDELRLLGERHADPLNSKEQYNWPIKGNLLTSRFESIAVVNLQLGEPCIQGLSKSCKQRLTETEMAHLHDGKTLLWIDFKNKGMPNLYMMRALSGSDTHKGYLLAEIAPGYLWGEKTGNNVSALTDILILGPAKELLFSSFNDSKGFLQSIKPRISADSFGGFDVRYNKKQYSLVYRLVFTQPKFLFEGYTVVLRQSKSFILAPIATFRHTFPAVVFISLIIVLLLSVNYIRKSLVPLDLLKEGILRVTHKNFHRRVELESDDEFGELANSFNDMAIQLDQQFKELNTRSKIDRSILSSMKTEEIIETAIKGMKEVFPKDSIVISLVNQVENHMATSYVASTDKSDIEQAIVSYSPWDIEILKQNRHHLIYNQGENLPRFLNLFCHSADQRFLILPIFFADKPAATTILTRRGDGEYKAENIKRARQVADQVAVALSNSQLVEELHSITFGTLNAFGRAVDAKSPWTAGHSDRVAKLAVKIGRRLNLDELKIDMLELAGILHDIGKIGVPLSILDKPGKLTTQEMDIIKKHPVVGARILEPIKVFSPIIPMILQHHEQLCGNGYPNGISGERIDLGARILTVADVFDALTSNRPYRNAMAVEKALSIIIEGSGIEFDPEVVKAFLEIVETEEMHPASGYVFIKNQLKYGS